MPEKERFDIDARQRASETRAEAVSQSVDLYRPLVNNRLKGASIEELQDELRRRTREMRIELSRTHENLRDMQNAPITNRTPAAREAIAEQIDRLQEIEPRYQEGIESQMRGAVSLQTMSAYAKEAGESGLENVAIQNARTNLAHSIDHVTSLSDYLREQNRQYEHGDTEAIRNVGSKAQESLLGMNTKLLDQGRTFEKDLDTQIRNAQRRVEIDRRIREEQQREHGVQKTKTPNQTKFNTMNLETRMQQSQQARLNPQRQQELEPWIAVVRGVNASQMRLIAQQNREITERELKRREQERQQNRSEQMSKTQVVEIRDKSMEALHAYEMQGETMEVGGGSAVAREQSQQTEIDREYETREEVEEKTEEVERQKEEAYKDTDEYRASKAREESITGSPHLDKQLERASAIAVGNAAAVAELQQKVPIQNIPLPGGPGGR